MTGSGRLFCSPDARWWGYQDSRSYAKVSSTSEAFYLDEVLCYESGDSVYGPSGSPPAHITESEGEQAAHTRLRARVLSLVNPAERFGLNRSQDPSIRSASKTSPATPGLTK